VRTLAWLSVMVAAFMIFEKLTTHNLHSVFGGVPEITAIREGHLRCQGAFRHPILAGCFGAGLIPLFVGLWFYRAKYRRLAVVGAICGLIMAVTASSSGALMAVLAAAGGLGFWSWRRHLRLVRWGAVLMIFALALVMKAPVWYLFAKLSNVAGGTGWHRAWLLDQTFAHFDEWWLFGTTYTAHWGPSGLVIAADPNMMDITNHYVMECVKGGLLKVGLFLVIVTRCFGTIGRRLKVEPAGSPTQYMVWALGVSLFTHCLSFMSITYFDQSILVWFWLLAVISGLVCIPYKRTTDLSRGTARRGQSLGQPGWETLAGAAK
jgi:hypothetical protein